jgi:2-polyprenyl-6-methoxyphenol hydroxylase-like FAD-dependent oxidoreductase
MQHNVDVLVIGAGQAGLAMGYYLKQNNILFAIVGRKIESEMLDFLLITVGFKSRMF